jgi:hypothetical protein
VADLAAGCWPPADPTSAANRTVHDCPACGSWQIDYDQAAYTSLSTSSLRRSPTGKVIDLVIDSSAFYRALEEEIGDHIAECPQWWNGAEPDQHCRPS